MVCTFCAELAKLCICTCMYYVCTMYVCVYVVCRCVCMYVCMCVCMHVCMYVLCMYVCVCMYVCMYVLCMYVLCMYIHITYIRMSACVVCDCVAKWLKHLNVNRKITGSSLTSYHRRKKKTSFFLDLAPSNPGLSKIVSWWPGLGWGRTRPLAVPNSTEVQLGLRVLTHHSRGA